MIYDSYIESNLLHVPSPVTTESYRQECNICHCTFRSFRKPVECIKCHSLVCEKCSVLLSDLVDNNNNNYNKRANKKEEEEEFNSRWCLACKNNNFSKQTTSIHKGNNVVGRVEEQQLESEQYYNDVYEKTKEELYEDCESSNKRRKENDNVDNNDINNFSRIDEEYDKVELDTKHSLGSNADSNNNNNNNYHHHENNDVYEHNNIEKSLLEELSNLRVQREEFYIELNNKNRELERTNAKLKESESRCHVLQEELNDQYEVIRQLGERLESVIDSNETLRRSLWSLEQAANKQQAISLTPTDKKREQRSLQTEKRVKKVIKEDLEQHEESIHQLHANNSDNNNKSQSQVNVPFSIIQPIITHIDPFIVISPLPKAQEFSSYGFDMKRYAQSLPGSLLPSIAQHMAEKWKLFDTSSTSVTTTSPFSSSVQENECIITTKAEQEQKHEEEEEEEEEFGEEEEEKESIMQRWVNYAAYIEANYSKINPYHNALHAADVIHSVVVLAETFTELFHSMTRIEKLALVFAALVHDVRHPGKSSNFLRCIHDAVYIQYNGLHVLEQMHTSTAFELLTSSHNFYVNNNYNNKDNNNNSNCKTIIDDIDKVTSQEAAIKKLHINFTSNMTSEEFYTFHDLSSYLILHTDMSSHNLLVESWLRTMAVSPHTSLDYKSNATTRKELLALILHAADVGVQSKGVAIAPKWLGIIHEMNNEQQQLQQLLSKERSSEEIKKEMMMMMMMIENKRNNNNSNGKEQSEIIQGHCILTKDNEFHNISEHVNETEINLKDVAPGQIQFLSSYAVPLFYIIHWLIPEFTLPLENLRNVISYYYQFVQTTVHCASFPLLPLRAIAVQTEKITNNELEEEEETVKKNEHEQKESKELAVQTDKIYVAEVCDWLTRYTEGRNDKGSELEKLLARVTVQVATRENELEQNAQELQTLKRALEKREERNGQFMERLWQMARILLNHKQCSKFVLERTCNNIIALHDKIDKSKALEREKRSEKINKIRSVNEYERSDEETINTLMQAKEVLEHVLYDLDSKTSREQSRRKQ